jgi:hypothetical protein
VAGPLPDRGVPLRAFARTQGHRAEQLRQPGAEVAAGDPREIADVECRRSADNNRAASTATASSLLNNDAPVQGPGGGGQRPRNGFPVQAGGAGLPRRYRLACHASRTGSPASLAIRSSTCHGDVMLPVGTHLPTVRRGCQKLKGQKKIEMKY